MDYVYHLAIRRRGKILAVQTAAGWMLPLCSCSPATRPLDAVARLLQQLESPGVVVTVIPVRYDASTSTLHWICGIDSQDSQPVSENDRWASLRPLGNGPALMREQLALRASYLTEAPIASASANPAPLWTNWIDDLRDWAGRRLALRDHKLGPVRKQYSIRAGRTVTSFDSTAGEIFGRVSAVREGLECRFAEYLAHTIPGTVPPLLEADAENGRMLCSKVSGICLADDRGPELYGSAARSLAAIQRQLAEHVNDVVACGVPIFGTEGIMARATEMIRAVAVTVDENDLTQRLASLARSVTGLWQELYESLDPARLGPSTWVNLDWSLGNLVMSAGTACTIDLEDSVVAPASLGVAVIDKYLGRLGTSLAADAYRTAWTEWQPAPHTRAQARLRSLRLLANVWRYLDHFALFTECEGAALLACRGLTAVETALRTALQN